MSIFYAGGWVMYPLLAMSVLSLALIFERIIFWSFGGGKQVSTRARSLNAISETGSRSDLIEHAHQTGGVLGIFVQLVLEHSDSPSEGYALGVIESVRTSIERFSVILSTIIAASPLLGILGTVTGIIQSFDLLGEAAAVSDPSTVAGGIAEALYTTAFGLMVSLMTLFPHVVFKSRAQRTLGYLESLAVILTDSSSDSQ